MVLFATSAFSAGTQELVFKTDGGNQKKITEFRDYLATKKGVISFEYNYLERCFFIVTEEKTDYDVKQIPNEMKALGIINNFEVKEGISVDEYRTRLRLVNVMGTDFVF